MILAYTKSRNVLIALLLITAVLTAMILFMHTSGFAGEKELLAIVVASLGFFISVSVSRLIMNSEILSLRYMLTNAMNLEKCAAELEKAARKMRKRSEDRFQTAVQASDAMSIIGQGTKAIEFLRSVTLDNPTPEHTTQFLLSAVRYSILCGDIEGAKDYSGKAATAISGLRQGIGKGIYEKEHKQFESFLKGEDTMLSHRFHTAETTLIKLEAAMMLSASDDIALRSECLEFISKPKEIE